MLVAPASRSTCSSTMAPGSRISARAASMPGRRVALLLRHALEPSGQCRRAPPARARGRSPAAARGRLLRRGPARRARGSTRTSRTPISGAGASRARERAAQTVCARARRRRSTSSSSGGSCSSSVSVRRSAPSGTPMTRNSSLPRTCTSCALPPPMSSSSAGCVGQVERGLHGEMDEAAFLLARDDARRHARLVPGEPQEIAAIARLAHRGRGGAQDAVHRQAPSQLHEPLERDAPCAASPAAAGGPRGTSRDPPAPPRARDPAR